MAPTPRNKTVLITGCSEGGIGHELAKEYHAKGLRVFASARRPAAMDPLRALGIECLQLDVTDLESIRAARETISAQTGGTLDILVNNAGQAYPLPATDLDMAQVRAMYDTNLFGVFTMVQEFVHLLIASGAGRIVNIGSVAGVFPFAFGSAYNAAKAALHAYGNTLRVELAPFNIKVITIVTGGVKSSIAAPHHLYSLPEDSLYQPIKDIFVGKRQTASQSGAMPTAVYARSVVAATLKSRPSAWVWCGKHTTIIWFFSTFFPRTIFDSVIAGMFGLKMLKSIFRQQKKTA